ncbi:PREDICTED: neurexin-3-like [Amphimedon queenslandica]|uniref:Laminin G domain-containing protein n=1 Tax=Amphimedon queenslandica TaxID=400682 RepID=A0A1X7VCP9_AMPQE|nr:PREDICTED: neurexin-3-like [Amphimedon queenslandica]|eukprot:XP_019849655.1 PREDICTED: neurexin-3-like [Amphimedon queenslandica]
MNNYIIVLSFCLLASFLYVPGSYAAQGLNHTFHPGNAYSRYYTWAAYISGRIELAFKTSEQNATLIYTASNVHLVHVALQNGRIGCSAKLASGSTDTGPLMQGTGTGLFNDDQWHHLILIHDTRRIIVRIDDNLETKLSGKSKYYALKTGTTPLYIGGIPLSVKPSPSSFKGCIKNVLIRNNTDRVPYWPSYAEPVFQNMTSPGCIEPCQDQTCREEEICINDWSNGVGVCSCAGRNESCFESITEGPIYLNGKSYQCYNILDYDSFSSYLSLRFEPPYPPNGVLLTFHSNSDSLHMMASLYIENSKLHFAVYRKRGSINVVSFNKSLLSDSVYHFSFSMNGSITFQSETYKETIKIRKSSIVHNTTKICLGRGTSELQAYKGTVDMLQKGLQTSLEGLPLNPTRLQYLPGDSCKHLFVQQTTQSKCESISLRVWMERPGTLIYMSKDDHMLNIQLDEGNITIDNGNITHRVYSEVITMKTWLPISFKFLSFQVRVIVDHFESAIGDRKWAKTIQAIRNETISIGKKPAANSTLFQGYIDDLSECPTIYYRCPTAL